MYARKGKRLVLTGVLFAAVITAHAQDCAHCNSPLEKAAYNKYNVDVTNMSDDQFMKEFCDIKEQEAQASSNSSLSVGTPKAKLGFASGSDTYSSLYTQFCQKDTARLTSYYRGIILSHMVHDPSLHEWSSCMNKCMELGGAGTGFIHAVRGSVGPAFTYVLRWRPMAGVDRVQIESFEVDGGMCKGTLKGKRIGNEGEPILCTRNISAKGELSSVSITARARNNAGFYATMIVPDMPEQVTKAVAVTKQHTCTTDRKTAVDMRDAGGNVLFTDPDRKVIQRHTCVAPGRVVSILSSSCSAGSCGWNHRVAGYDSWNEDTAYIGWKTNSGDSATIVSVVNYETTETKCVKNCTPFTPVFVPNRVSRAAPLKRTQAPAN